MNRIKRGQSTVTFSKRRKISTIWINLCDQRCEEKKNIYKIHSNKQNVIICISQSPLVSSLGLTLHLQVWDLANSQIIKQNTKQQGLGCCVFHFLCGLVYVFSRKAVSLHILWGSTCDYAKLKVAKQAFAMFGQTNTFAIAIAQTGAGWLHLPKCLWDLTKTVALNCEIVRSGLCRDIHGVISVKLQMRDDLWPDDPYRWSLIDDICQTIYVRSSMRDHLRKAFVSC